MRRPRRRGQALDPARAACALAVTAPTRPRRLHQQTAQLARPRFRDVPAMPALRRTVFARHQPDRRTDLAGAARSASHVDRQTRGTSAPRPARRPGTLCSRCTTGSASRRASAAARPSPRSPSVSASTISGAAAPASRPAPAGRASRASRAGTRSALPAARADSPLAAAAPASAQSSPLRICTNCRRLRSTCRSARCAADTRCVGAIPAAPIRLGQAPPHRADPFSPCAASSPYIGA